MKLVRFGKPGAERAGMVDAEGAVRDVSRIVRDWNAQSLGDGSLQKVAAADAAGFPPAPDGARLGAPVAAPGKLIIIGLNYAAHAAETNAAAPQQPIVVLISPQALCGPNDDIILPPGSAKSDWEVELAVVMGRSANNVAEADALSHVAGYAIANDVSEREVQLQGAGQWGMGKSFPTFAPLGPWLVTADEIPDPQNLTLTLELNGKVRQQGHTSDMIFTVAQLISYISAITPLHPGDTICTGTPPGVGMGQKPPEFLRAGDELRLAVEGLGEQRCKVAGG